MTIGTSRGVAAPGVHSDVAAVQLDSRPRNIAATIIALGSIASILSSTTINIAIPTLQRVFNADLTEVQWVISGYLLGLAAVIPLSGYLSEKFGAKRVYLATLCSFIAASVLCGVARSIGSEIAFRVIQGMAGGMVMPVGMTMLMRMTPPQQRGRMMGFLGIPMLLAPAVGPAIGGLLIQYFDWQWIFWINIPVCALALGFGIKGLKDSEHTGRGRLDLVGLILCTPGVVAIIYGLTTASSGAGWGSLEVLGSTLGGLGLIGAFIVWELRQREPLLDLRIFRDAAFAGSSVVNVILGAALFGAVFVVPVFLQQVQGYGTLNAGLIIGAQGLGAALMMPLSGWLTDRFGARIVVFTGLATLTVASTLLTTITPETTAGLWVTLLLFRGIAMGFSMMPNQSAAYVTLAPSAIGRATAINNTLQRLASSIGIAVLASAATIRIGSHLASVQPAQLGGAGALPVAARVATAAGLVDTLWLSVAISFLALPAALLLRRPLLGLPHGTPHPPLSTGLGRVAIALTALSIAGFLLALARTFY